MKIYTRTGDAGDTGLFGGERIPKDDARVEAYGAVDEANATLGLARALLNEGNGQTGEPAVRLDEDLGALQSLLFDVGADLATPHGARQRAYVRAIDDHDVTLLEEWIDRYDVEIPPLKQFVLPGGTSASGALQMARTMVRRAERRCVTLARHAEIGAHVVPALNRLSDLLFTLARVANVRAGHAEVPWQARKPATANEGKRGAGDRGE